MNTLSKQDIRVAILNAFTPNLDIRDPSTFAGRKSLILRLADSLVEDGSCPVIYGQQGLGKTSLAMQIIRIALGDVELLENLEASDRIIRPDRAFEVLYIACPEDTQSKDDILRRLMEEATVYDETSFVEKDRTHSVALKFGPIEGRSSWTYNRSLSQSSDDRTVEEQFFAFIDHLVSKSKRRILCVVDEFDRVKNRKGMAGFLKNIADINVKFLLIGVATDVSSLLADHRSIERKLNPVHVQEMEEYELEEIVSLVVRRTTDMGVPINFNDSARKYLAEAAHGLPWYVHAVGQESLRIAWDSGYTSVMKWDVESGEHKLARDQLKEQFYGLYRAIIGRSQNRERVLRLVSKFRDERVPLAEIHKTARSFGITQPSTYIASLCEGERALVKSGSGLGATVSFRNAIFKRYVHLCEPVFTDSRDIDINWLRTYDPERL
ncbi:MAG: AAA family ATPase [Gammaproteobacteria bacterium]|nr:AAA family ATPase [Pseudomonadales bacterium]